MLVFGQGEKPEDPEENLSEQGRKSTNSAHIWRRDRKSNPGHFGGKQALPQLRQPWSLRGWSSVIAYAADCVRLQIAQARRCRRNFKVTADSITQIEFLLLHEINIQI